MDVIGVDTTFLVEATVQETPRHAAARRYLREAVVSRQVSLAVAPQVLTEFVHVVTDPSRFERPLSVAQARGLASLWWRAKEVRQVFPTSAAVDQFFSWMKEHRLGRKRLLDTFLAATYQSQGIATIASTNARDFAVFGCFQIIVP